MGITTKPTGSLLLSYTLDADLARRFSDERSGSSSRARRCGARGHESPAEPPGRVAARSGGPPCLWPSRNQEAGVVEVAFGVGFRGLLEGRRWL